MSDEIAAAALATLGALGLVYLQRHFDRASQRAQIERDNVAARQAEVAAGVIELWSAASRTTAVAQLLSSRTVQRWRWGALVGIHVVEVNNLLGEVIAASTRIFLSGDEEIIAAAWRVMGAAGMITDSVNTAPWWKPRSTKAQGVALQRSVAQLTDALHELREIARSKLGRELVELPGLAQPRDDAAVIDEAQAASATLA